MAECRSCKFYHRFVSGNSGACRKDPQQVLCNDNHWCGQFVSSEAHNEDLLLVRHYAELKDFGSVIHLLNKLIYAPE